MDFGVLGTKQMDINKHREMLIGNLGIFELRALGRELGVQSPTTKKRDDLVDLILDKLYHADTTVPVKMTKKGRPFKKLSNLDEIIDRMTDNDDTLQMTSQKRPLRYEDIICFSQDVPVFSQVVEEIHHFKGVLRSSVSTSYFIDIKTGYKIFLTDEALTKYKLQDGDFVECKAKKINSSNQFMMIDCQTVNFIPVANYQPNKLEGTPIISNVSLPYGDFQLMTGRRNLIVYTKNLFEDNRFVSFADTCKKQGIRLIVLGLNTSFEDQIMFNNLSGIVNMTTEYGSGYDIGFDKIIDTISLAQRLREQGENVIVFVSDFVEMLNTLDLCFKETESMHGHKAKGLVVAQKLISLGRAFDNESAITIVLTNREVDQKDIFIQNELEKICSTYKD